MFVTTADVVNGMLGRGAGSGIGNVVFVVCVVSVFFVSVIVFLVVVSVTACFTGASSVIFISVLIPYLLVLYVVPFDCFSMIEPSESFEISVGVGICSFK